MNFWQLVLLSSGTSVVLFSMTWWAASRVDNYSLVDAMWGAMFCLLAPLIVAFSDGFPPRKIILGAMFFIWGLRLSSYLFRRILSHLDQEDSRYQTLRHEYGKNFKLRFFIFFQYQAISVIYLLLPLWLVIRNHDELLHPFEIIGVGIWLIGIVGEATADRQMANFVKKSKDPKQVCKVGLWRYSRHPNYFFESVIWLGYGIYACVSPNGYLTWLATFSMWLLLLKVTGVPLAEKQNLKKRGEAYRQYQKETSIFVPLPRKR